MLNHLGISEFFDIFFFCKLSKIELVWQPCSTAHAFSFSGCLFLKTNKSFKLKNFRDVSWQLVVLRLRSCCWSGLLVISDHSFIESTVKLIFKFTIFIHKFSHIVKPRLFLTITVFPQVGFVTSCAKFFDLACYLNLINLIQFISWCFPNCKMLGNIGLEKGNYLLW